MPTAIADVMVTAEGSTPRDGKTVCGDPVLLVMGSHALTPPLSLHVPRVWIVVAIVAVVAVGVVGVLFALTLPAGHPTAPAQFQGV